MRLANGMGCCSKMPGQRRKPWRARVTVGWAFDEVLMRQKQITKDIGYFRTRAEALKALMDYNDNPFDLDLMKVTMRDCFEEAQKGFTDGRRHNYMAAWRYLEPIADLPIRSIKANQMQKCIDSCETTQQQEIKTCCHKIFAYALRNDIIDKDPSRLLHSNSVTTQIAREVFTLKQVKMVESGSEWYHKLTTMLLYTGMRTKELKELNPDDIDLGSRTVHIAKAKNRSSIRTIPIHEHILPLFSEYKDFGCNLYGYTHDGLNKALKALCGHTAHDCRHTFATRMRECGCDPLVLQLLLGHTPSTITEKVYTHITIEELATFVNMLNYRVKK